MKKPPVVPLIVACGLFMEHLDSTVLNTALPAIAVEFNENPVHLKLAVTSYLLSLAVFIPASGWVADRFGARNVFRAAIVVFMLGSVACGLSSSMGEMVVARIIQGMGGAMMTPVGRLILLRSVPRSELVSAMAWIAVPALIGPIMGPPVGGFLTTFLSWHWIFWINVPIGLLGLYMVTRYIPDIRADAVARFDGVGFAVTALGLSALVTGSTTLGLGILAPIWTGSLMAAGAALLAWYAWRSWRRPDAILDLRLFLVPTFRFAVLGGGLYRIGVGAAPFLLPLLLQLGLGMTAFESGLMICAVAVGALVMKPAAPPVLRWLGFRAVLAWGAVLGAVLLAAPALFGPATPWAVILAALFLTGFQRSLQFTAINALGYADIEQGRMSAATSLTSVMQQLTLSAGVTIGAIAVELTHRGRGGADFVAGDFVWAFVATAVLSGLAVFLFAAMDRNAGAEVAGRKPS